MSDFCPVTKSVDEHCEPREMPWKGRVRITFQLDPDVTVDTEFQLDHAHDEEHAIEQIKAITADQTHVQIL